MAGVARGPLSLVAIDKRGGKDRMKPPSLTGSACRCAAAARGICSRALSRSSQTRSRSRWRDVRSKNCAQCMLLGFISAAHARQQKGGGMATTLVHSAQGGGTFSTHVHTNTGWKDWASTPVHVSIGWTVRWVLRHCSQPPPRYQSRGCGSAAIAARGPQRMYRCWCNRCIVGALPLLLHCNQPPPPYHRGAMGLCKSRTQAGRSR